LIIGTGSLIASCVNRPASQANLIGSSVKSLTVTDRTERDRVPLCPSFHCVAGAALLGIIGSNGEVAYIRPAPIVDQGFVENAKGDRSPEERFRFAAPCVTSSCSYWKEAKCEVVDHAIAVGETLIESASVQALPRCDIRSDCRWFAQRGRAACMVCPSIFNHHPEVER
jgi:hypothetical protein